MEFEIAKKQLQKLHELFKKEEEAVLASAVSCTEQCPVCSNGCSLHEPRNKEQAEFIQSLVPPDTKIHRCNQYHQWLTGKYGVQILAERGTNRNFLDECKEIVEVNEKNMGINPPPMTPIVTSTSTTWPSTYSDYTSTLYVNTGEEVEEQIEDAIQAAPTVIKKKKKTIIIETDEEYEVDKTFSEDQKRDITLEDE